MAPIVLVKPLEYPTEPWYVYHYCGTCTTLSPEALVNGAIVIAIVIIVVVVCDIDDTVILIVDVATLQIPS